MLTEKTKNYRSDLDPGRHLPVPEVKTINCYIEFLSPIYIYYTPILIIYTIIVYNVMSIILINIRKHFPDFTYTKVDLKHDFIHCKNYKIFIS